MLIVNIDMARIEVALDKGDGVGGVVAAAVQTRIRSNYVSLRKHRCVHRNLRSCTTFKPPFGERPEYAESAALGLS